jgi:hypothetical protein
MVGREGIEPSTNGLRGEVDPCVFLVNQALAALADLETSVIRSQFGHNQSGLVTNGLVARHRLAR